MLRQRILIRNSDDSVGFGTIYYRNESEKMEVAKKAGTIPYEILTGISQRVKRIYLQE